MFRHRTFLCALVTLLASHCSADQAFLDKALAADAGLLAAQKDGFHSHLERMLQVETVPKPQPETKICSPDAMKRAGGCGASDSGFLNIFKANQIKLPSQRSIASCTGPSCLVAPMPGEVVAPLREGVSSIDGLEHPKAPQSKSVTYGPMTQDAFQRMAARKRAALKSKLEDAGVLDAEMDAFLNDPPFPSEPKSVAAPAHEMDVHGIPLPAASSNANTTSSAKAPSSELKSEDMKFESSSPASNKAVVNKAKADFEMRFEPQTPSPDPHLKAPEVGESPAAATTPRRNPKADFEMRFTPQTPTADPSSEAQKPKEEEGGMVAESPAPAPTETSASEAQQKEQKACSASASGACVGSGPARPPMTEQEAARLAAQQATNAAAREAALARKRDAVRSEQIASQAKRGNSGVNNFPTASKPRGHPVPTPGFSSSSSSASSSAASPSSQQPQKPAATSTAQKRRQAQQTSHARSSSSRGPAVVSSSLLVGASAHWDLLDYVCVLSILGVVAAAVLVVAAVVEDLMAPRQVTRMEGTPLALHWISLARGLWRRCRRAFGFAAKHLAGHGPDLPLSTNDGHPSVVARALASSSTFIRVFFAHLAHLRSSQSCRSRGNSGGGCGLLDGPSWAAVDASSSTSPFASAAVQQQACVFQADELPLRRRH